MDSSQNFHSLEVLYGVGVDGIGSLIWFLLFVIFSLIHVFFLLVCHCLM